MSQPCLPDVNVWLALCMSAHLHHRAGLNWFDEDADRQSYFCRTTQQGLLRLLTTSAVTSLAGAAPLSNRNALKTMGRLLEDHRIGFVNEPVGISEQWATYADSTSASPKLWMDAYLAAFARCAGYELVTIDKGFKQFKGVRVRVLEP